MRRILLLFTAAAMMAVVLATSASPALANHNRDDGFSGSNFGDQELESGSIEFDTNISIDGNNSDQGVGLTQFANTGNYANQQGFDGEDDDCWAWDWRWGWYYWCD